MDRLRTDVVAAVAMSVRSGSAPCRPRTTAFEHSDGWTQNRRPRLRASPGASTTTTGFFDALGNRPRGSKAGAPAPRRWAAPWIGHRRQPVFVGEGSPRSRYRNIPEQRGAARAGWCDLGGGQLMPRRSGRAGLARALPDFGSFSRRELNARRGLVHASPGLQDSWCGIFGAPVFTTFSS